MDFTAIAALANTIITRIWPDKSEQEKQKFILAMQQELAQTDLMKGQMEANANQANNPSLFVSGARPFIMWVCGISFAWQFLIQPIVIFISVAIGHPIPPLPAFDYMTLNTMLFSLLGLGGMRTFEKYKGVQGNH